MTHATPDETCFAHVMRRLEVSATGKIQMTEGRMCFYGPVVNLGEFRILSDAVVDVLDSLEFKFNPSYAVGPS